MDGDGIHAAQVLRVVRAVAQPQMQRRLAIAVGGEVDPRHRDAQFAVIIDLAVADQCGGAGEQRLIAGHQVDDRQPVVHQRDPADDGVTGAVGSAMVQVIDQPRQGSGSGGGAPEDRIRPAMPHIQGFSTVARNCRQRATTGASAYAAS